MLTMPMPVAMPRYIAIAIAGISAEITVCSIPSSEVNPRPW